MSIKNKKKSALKPILSVIEKEKEGTDPSLSEFKPKRGKKGQTRRGDERGQSKANKAR